MANIPKVLTTVSEKTQGFVHGGLPIRVEATIPDCLYLNESINIPFVRHSHLLPNASLLTTM